ncbi:MAG TPA: hypothetical protein VK928_11645 [Longimicrobiales bacterium]|nr:hypothetical protein [Longimicrobiales bacterium]
MAALLALAGFTALFAGSLTASCVQQDAGEAAVQDHAMHTPMQAPAETAPEPAGHCPDAMLHGPCAVAATLPSVESAVVAPAPGLEAVAAVPADAVHQLFIRTLFHPPRA